MSDYANTQPPTKIGLCVLTSILVYLHLQTSPVMIRGEIQWLPAILGGLAFLTGMRLISETLESIARGVDWLAAHKPTGKSGTSQWGKYKEYKHETSKKDTGPFWGLSIDNKKLFIDFSSNAAIIGPSGVGKGHTVVVPLIFLIQHSKVIMDFKPELLAICKKGLGKLGQKVIALDPFGVHKSRTGETALINFLDIICDDLYRPGGLIKVYTDGDEFATQLYPDPPNQQGDSRFWNNGTRKILSILSIAECMINGYEGTLENESILISDPSQLELHLCSLVGEHLDGTESPEGPYLFELSDWAEKHNEDDLIRFLRSFRADCKGLLVQMRETKKQFSSFLEGANQAIEPYGFGELSSAIGPTSFDVNAIKDGNEIINLFIVGDASHQKRTEQFFGTVQWYIQTKMKRHPKKDIPVYFINDEINNYSIYGYTSLLSWCRGFSIRTINILQNLPAYAEKHGRHAVEVLMSESEIKLLLPGQRNTETIERFVKMMGEQSVMASNLNVGNGKQELSESTSETSRKLMTEDELARSPYGILFVRNQRPILQKPISYSEIKPLRTLADINPFHPKPFLRKVKLKLKLPKQRKK